MNLNPNQDKEAQPLSAFVAPLAGIGTFVLVMLPCLFAFSNNKTAMPLSFFVAAAAGIYIGRLCYNNSQPTNDELTAVASDKQNESLAPTLWVSGLAFQVLAYFALCLLLGTDLRLVPSQYGHTLWIGFNSLVFLSMLVSLVTVFRVHRDIKNQLVHLFWSIVLFAILYSSFHYAATWIADPNTIPGKLEW